MLEPSGSYWGYKGAATGKGRQSAKAELEKLVDQHTEALTAREAVKQAARIIYLAHEDNKEKDFELEVSWCSLSETNGLHKFVKGDLLQEAIDFAQKELNGDDDDDNDDSDNVMSSDDENAPAATDANANANAATDQEGDIHLE